MTPDNLLDALRAQGRVAGQLYAIPVEDVEALLKADPKLTALLERVDAEALAAEIYDAIGAIGIREVVLQVVWANLLAAADWPEVERDDPLDGDHVSALASAGLGTDEDYGCFGGNEE